jgi:prolyl-tRNA synthetase
MPISDVKLMLHGGSSQNSITVKRRHTPEKISAATEMELTESGAKPALIAALKDENNILTENQKDAFDNRMKLINATRQGVAAMQSSAAVSAGKRGEPRTSAATRPTKRDLPHCREQADRASCPRRKTNQGR